MAHVILQYAYFIVFMTFYVGQGDGRFKKTTKDTLKHDMKLYKKMIEKISKDLDLFEEEYPNDPLIDYYEDNLYYLQDHSFDNTRKKMKHNIFNMKDLNTNEHENTDPSLLQTKNTKFIISNVTNKISFKDERYTWPKFEDILLAMGKKYDWKNDRWIKIKNYVKDDIKKDDRLIISSELHEKHKFKYRIVKLNRTKSKRNIVIAVTAVR